MSKFDACCLFSLSLMIAGVGVIMSESFIVLGILLGIVVLLGIFLLLYFHEKDLTRTLKIRRGRFKKSKIYKTVMEDLNRICKLYIGSGLPEIDICDYNGYGEIYLNSCGIGFRCINSNTIEYFHKLEDESYRYKEYLIVADRILRTLNENKTESDN